MRSKCNGGVVNEASLQHCNLPLKDKYVSGGGNGRKERRNKHKFRRAYGAVAVHDDDGPFKRVAVPQLVQHVHLRHVSTRQHRFYGFVGALERQHRLSRLCRFALTKRGPKLAREPLNKELHRFKQEEGRR